MKASLLDRIVEAVLYEGYILYPYRSSSKKNLHRFTFGRVYPEDYSRAQNGAEPFQMQTECLLRAPAGSEVNVRVGFLQPVARQVGVFAESPGTWPPRDEMNLRWVPALEVDGALHASWQETVERRIAFSIRLEDGAFQRESFAFPASRTLEPIRDREQDIAGVFLRRQSTIEGGARAEISAVREGLWKITVRTCNHSPTLDSELEDAEAVLLRTFASTHIILQAAAGSFISPTDPPQDCAGLAGDCRNLGTWPVLVGDEAQDRRDVMLASPIILPDFPRIAPESAGNLYDGTEIDEILTLRILTMTEEEKREMRGVDEHARRILERTESLGGDDLMKMHGAMRDVSPLENEIFGSNSAPVTSVEVNGVRLAAGDAVRIRPKVRADAVDLVLADKIAVIESIEEDAEGRVHLALVLQDDPGADLGMMRQPGHRFFYGVDEVEPVLEARS